MPYGTRVPVAECRVRPVQGSIESRQSGAPPVPRVATCLPSVAHATELNRARGEQDVPSSTGCRPGEMHHQDIGGGLLVRSNRALLQPAGGTIAPRGDPPQPNLASARMSSDAASRTQDYSAGTQTRSTGSLSVRQEKLQGLSATVALHVDSMAQESHGKLEFVSSVRDLRNTHPRANGQRRTRAACPPRVADAPKSPSSTLRAFLSQRFQTSKDKHASQLNGTHSTASMPPAAAHASERHSASMRQPQAVEDLVRELASAIATASGETPPWVHGKHGVALSDAERGLNDLMGEYVDAHAAEHLAHCDAVSKEVQAIHGRLKSPGSTDCRREPQPEPEPDQHLAKHRLSQLIYKQQLLQLKEQAMPGVLQAPQAPGEENGAQPASALVRLELGSSQLADEFDLSDDALLQLYRTLYVFLFGFNSAVSSVIGKMLPTLTGSDTANKNTLGTLRPRLWRTYFMLVDLMISSCYSRALEESQLRALGGMAQQFTSDRQASLSAQADQAESVASMRKQVKELRAALADTGHTLAAKDAELERLETRERDLISAYQALTSSITLRRFELDERLARGQSKKAASTFVTEPHRLDETASSQRNLARILAEQKAKGTDKLNFELDDPQNKASAKASARLHS
eukprot:COSAG02_NODE_1585_length_11820_cov_3.247078_3_plen_633_part_00